MLALSSSSFFVLIFFFRSPPPFLLSACALHMLMPLLLYRLRDLDFNDIEGPLTGTFDFVPELTTL